MGGLSKDPEKRARQLANLKPPTPAPKGHQRGLKHGAHAPVPPARLDAKTEAIYAELAGDAPVRGPDGELPRYDRHAVLMLADCLCRLDGIREWLGPRSVVSRKGRVRSVVRHEARLRREAREWMDELGMTPRSRAKLGVDLARTADLATAMSEPDPERRRRLMADAGLDVEGEDDDD